MITLHEAITRYGVDVDPHHEREAAIPVICGLQAQGDLIVVPAAQTVPIATEPVPASGVAVVRGESGGNTHLILADGPVFFSWVERSRSGLVLGVLTVPAGSVGYLAHPEHAYSGVGPGRYELRRQREQANVIRVVAD